MYTVQNKNKGPRACDGLSRTYKLTVC